VERRDFIGTLVLLAAPLTAEGQEAGKVYKVGLLTLGADPTRSPFRQKVLEAMRELKYVEGRNLIIRRAFAGGDVDRLPGLVADLVQAKVDVIVTTSTQETLVAKRATSTIPIVMTVAPDPVEQGLVVSLARPGGNVTGLTSMAPGTSQKLVELLREALPLATRFAVLASGPTAPFPEIRRELQVAAQQVGVTLSFIEIKGTDDFDPALARAKKDGVGGIIAPLSAFTYAHRAECGPGPCARYSLVLSSRRQQEPAGQHEHCREYRERSHRVISLSLSHPTDLEGSSQGSYVDYGNDRHFVSVNRSG